MRLVWWLAAVVAISVFAIFLSEQRMLDPVQNLSLTVSAPASGGLRDAARPVDDLFRGITDRGDIVDENRSLRQQVEALEQALAQQQDAQQRVRELEEALGVKQGQPEDQLLAANVIAEDTSGLKRMIAIDSGLGDGLDEGMVVLSRGGSLVGTVSRAYEDFAWVRLITDPDSTVNAQVVPAPSPQSSPAPSDVIIGATPTPQPAGASPGAAAAPTPAPTVAPTPVATPGDQGSSLRGVVEGDLRHGLWLDLLPPDLTLPEGSLVSTSGLGGNYPRALLIGSVEAVEQRPQSPFTSAEIEPAASLSGLDTVLVLLSFTPARLTEQ
jgi:rod shape-determining protein MreC